MNKYETKKILLIMLCISTVITVLGLGLSAYNYYVFGQPFINSTTKGLLNAFFLCTLIVIMGLAKKTNKNK